MSSLSLKVSRPSAWNRKQSILQFLKKFKHQFDMKEDAIDLREMCKNYPNQVIPLEDIFQAISAVVGPSYKRSTTEFDPSGGAVIQYKDVSLSPRFGYVEWKDLYLWPIFQRDVAPNHVEKINKDFDPTCIIVPCAIKITLKTGETIFCLWDGHHTAQVCHLRGYTTFPVWYIDIDHIPLSVIEEAGFGSTDDERIKFGAWKAGNNMRTVNGKCKRMLSPYDDFLIGYDTRDSFIVSMMNILTKNKCSPKRHATCAGAFTQIKSGIECYKLTDSNGVKGRFWDRALRFHRTHWPAAPLTLEIFRPMSYLYQLAELQGIDLPNSVDDDLGQLLIAKWGDPDSVQEEIKDSFWNAYHKNSLTGIIPNLDKDRVLNGLINLYNQSSIANKSILPAPDCQWRV